MDGITFYLVPVADEISPNKKVYRAVVKASGTVGKEELAAALAEKTGQDRSLATYFLDALNEVLGKMLVAGYRVNLGQLATGFAIKGSFTSEDDRFDARRHALQPTIQALDPLKGALASVGASNIAVSLVCRVGSLMDFVTKRLNEIAGSHELHIEGENLGLDAQNPDEHVVLLADDGTVAAAATVSASDAQTITCSFAEPPAPGTYTLEVACRNGNRASLAPAVARLRNVAVVAAQEGGV